MAMALRASTTLVTFSLLFSAAAPAQTSGTGWTVLGWNDLGMHCMDGDYAVYAILPPYNTIHAQVIDSNGSLVKSGSGVTVTYEAVADPAGSINAVSLWKTNFWTFAAKLFGVKLSDDTGLTGNAMPGSANQRQPMKFEPAHNWFTADGIPVTPYDDRGDKNYYPMMRITARDGSGSVLATTDIVLPVSDEMDCRVCHASGARPDTKPSSGWAQNPLAERDYKLNILGLHDDRQASSPAYKNALAAMGYSSAGLYATATNGTPVLCASCHASNALSTKGQPGIPQLTISIHGYHAHVTDPATGSTLDSAQNRSACYRCHPGSATRCLRGVMGNSVAADGSMAIQCQNCHGTMSVVGAVGRKGWFDEPNCQSCHTGTATANSGQIRFTSVFSAPGQMRTPADTTFATNPNAPAAGISLYRFSAGHGGLACEACHDSTHAELPSSHASDNVQNTAIQGYAGPLIECFSCHTGSLPAGLNGPHGMHGTGDAWVQVHPDVVEQQGSSACRACHGSDYAGTVLSRASTSRTLSAFGGKQLWRGFQVSCYLCHNGPDGEGSSPYSPAAVSNVSGSAHSGASVTVPLTVSDPSAVLRVVSQPAHGTVSIAGAAATYSTPPDFEGDDAFTYAAWNGKVDSNLATSTVHVSATTRPAFAANGVVNAASYAAGGVSPGEMITVFGSNLGPAGTTTLVVNSAGLISRTLGATRVLFDTLAAPVIFTSAGQLAAMVPYGVSGKTTTQMRVEYGGIQSLPVTVPVLPSVPGIFSTDMSGKGQGSILNVNPTDGSLTLNSASNPAARGSAIAIYATGEGAIDQPFVDGQLALATLAKPLLGVTASVGGIPAEVLYAGSAPTMVAGFFQVNLKIPDNAPTGPAVPVVLMIGGTPSQDGLTIAVQ